MMPGGLCEKHGFKLGQLRLREADLVGRKLGNASETYNMEEAAWSQLDVCPSETRLESS